MSTQEVGSPAPSFDRESDSGEHVTLDSLRGRPVVLYFYPKDDTPGCTRQACSIRDSWGEFGKAGVTLFGVSPDTVRRRIAESHNLMGFDELVCMLQFGTLPGHLTEKNIRRFASEVMPAIKTLGERDYRGFEMPRVAAE